MEKDMNMQDKEIDALFRAKLDGLEAEPSANLWAGIASGIDADKKKRSLKPYLAVAATIVVMLTAGILFIPGARVDAPVAVKSKPVKQRPVAKQPPVETLAGQQPAYIVKNASPVLKAKTASAVKYSAPAIEVEKAVVSIQPDVTLVMEEPIAAVAAPVIERPAAVVPDDVELIQKNITVEPEPFRTKRVALTQVNLPQDSTRDAVPAKKKKINSFGGLLNALVAKIDKRKDKLIEFSDADGENNITGINLGIIKIKKEE